MYSIAVFKYFCGVFKYIYKYFPSYFKKYKQKVCCLSETYCRMRVIKLIACISIKFHIIDIPDNWTKYCLTYKTF